MAKTEEIYFRCGWLGKAFEAKCSTAWKEKAQSILLTFFLVHNFGEIKLRWTIVWEKSVQTVPPNHHIYRISAVPAPFFSLPYTVSTSALLPHSYQRHIFNAWIRSNMSLPPSNILTVKVMFKARLRQGRLPSTWTRFGPLSQAFFYIGVTYGNLVIMLHIQQLVKFIVSYQL